MVWCVLCISWVGSEILSAHVVWYSFEVVDNFPLFCPTILNTRNLCHREVCPRPPTMILNSWITKHRATVVQQVEFQNTYNLSKVSSNLLRVELRAQPFWMKALTCYISTSLSLPSIFEAPMWLTSLVSFSLQNTSSF